MSRATTHYGYYVTAKIDSGTANQRVAWLVGPFDDDRGALWMVEPVRRACVRNSPDARFAFAGFGIAKMMLPRTKPLPAGRMDLAWLDIDDVINASRDNPQWSKLYA